ncbi:uncharacterized protein [Macrobrachium rosenbergii]|uniref:uncharacterized protein n=1 Tax=Macrobrachium rosenbergii TaxID=79674 RepID=UPI0034D5715A
MDDCYKYTCSNGEWLKSTESDPQCCNIWNSAHQYENFNHDNIDQSLYDWWYTNSSWTGAYQEYIEVPNYGLMHLNGTMYNSRCQEFICTAKDTIIVTQGIQQDCCEYNMMWYHHAQPVYKEDCIGYVCWNGTWLKTNHTNQYCCNIWNSVHQYENFYHDNIDQSLYDWWYSNGSWTGAYQEYSEVSNYGLMGPNGTMYNSRCQEFICTAKDTIILTQEIQQDCCEFNMTWYHHAQPVYKEDCIGYVCWNGTWLKTDHTKLYCCDIWNSVHQYENFYHDNIDYILYDWWYTNSSWTGAYQEYSEVPNYGLMNHNGTMYNSRCQEFICTAKDTIIFTQEIQQDCCEYNMTWYHHAQPVYKEDCIGYVCWNGTWLQTNHTNQYCCDMWNSIHQYENFYHDSIDYILYDWWYTNSSWISAYQEYSEVSNYGLMRPNGTMYNSRCQEFICTAKDTIIFTQEIQQDCCEYNMTWYHHAQPVYKEDCIGYVCWNGTWLKTSHTKLYCCDIWNSVHQYENFYHDNIDQSLFDWWYTNSSWTSAYQEYSEVSNYGLMNPNGTMYNSRCQEFICTAKDTIIHTQEIQQDCCEYNMTWYHHAQPIYKEDCIGYVCWNGTWLKTNHTKLYCCDIWNSVHQYENFYHDNIDQSLYDWWYTNSSWTSAYQAYSEVSNYGLMQRNGTMYNSRCQEFICTAKDTIIFTQEIQQDCCEYNMTWYHHAQPVYKEDCIAYVCWNGTWLKTNHTNLYCCNVWNSVYQYENFYHDNIDQSLYGWWYTNSSWTSAYQEYSEVLYYGLMPPNGTMYNSRCQEFICTAKDTIISTRKIHQDCCEYDMTWYHHAQPIYNEECVGYVCWNGIWLKTSYSKPYCCSIWSSYLYTQYNFYPDIIDYRQYEWWYSNISWTSAYQQYTEDSNYGFMPYNGAMYTSRCQEFICKAKDTIIFTQEIHQDCCEYGGTWYHHAQPVYKADCIGYVCWNGTWLETDHSEPYCCNIWSADQYKYYNFYHDSIDQSLYDWWYTNISWTTAYQQYTEVSNYGFMPYNGAIYTSRCQEFICTAKDTIILTQNINQDCCQFDGTWYHHAQPLYGADCIGYVCWNGSWLKTNNSKPYCCNIWSADQYKYYNFYHDSIDQSLYDWWYTNISWTTAYQQYTEVSNYGFMPYNGAIYTSRCQEFTCTARDTIILTQNINQDCCEYGGTWYHHAQPVYKADCIGYVCWNGSWLNTNHSDPYCCSIWNSYLHIEYNMYHDSVDYILYDWWHANITWTSAYQQYVEVLNSGFMQLNGTIYTSRCQELICIAKDTIILTQEIRQDCCEYGGTWYHHAQPLYETDCIGYVCWNGTWLNTNHTDPYCCADVYNNLEYNTMTTDAGNLITELQETSTIPSTANTGVITLARSRQRIFWEDLYPYYVDWYPYYNVYYTMFINKFPWWDDKNGSTSWYEEYHKNENELGSPALL